MHCSLTRVYPDMSFCVPMKLLPMLPAWGRADNPAQTDRYYENTQAIKLDDKKMDYRHGMLQRFWNLVYRTYTLYTEYVQNED